MYKVMLADDEFIIRNGISNSILWDKLGLELIAVVENGKQALEFAEKLRPDIIISDIRMPYIDGLKLIERIKDIYCENYIVLISGHDEFEYARKAIKLGVYDYLLKPIDLSALNEILLKIVLELNSQREKKNELIKMHQQVSSVQNLLVQRLYFRYLTKVIDKNIFQQELLKISENTQNAQNMNAYCCIVVEIDNFDNFTCNMNETEIFSMTDSIENIFKKYINEGNIIIEETVGKYILIIKSEDEEKVRIIRNVFISRLRNDLGRRYNYTTSSGNIYSSIDDLAKSYNEAGYSIDQAFVYGNNKDFFYENVKETVAATHNYDISKMIKSISTFDKNKIKEDFDEIEKEIRGIGAHSFLFTRIVVSSVYAEIVKLLSNMQYPLQSFIDDPMSIYKVILNCKTLKEMMTELYSFVEKVCDFLSGQKKGINSIVIQKAKEFIKLNFTNPKLTLDMVATYSSISPNYFSLIFKQETGMPFICYLTSVRLDHAKTLLGHGNFRAYEVSYMCGYDNPTYFSTIFKKNVGVSPSEYKE